MKKFVLLIISIIAFYGCETENGNNEDIYFVKYASEKPGAMISYTNENGEQVYITRTGGSGDSTFERVVGPVYKGFKCYLSMDNGTGINNQPVRIEVKRNNEPFVVKVEGVAYVTYTIK